MLINGIELSSLGVKLYDRVISSNRVKTQEAWLEGDIQPTSIRQQDSFKSIQLKFLVLCQDEEEAFYRISKLTQLLRKATIQFDDMNYQFEVSMNGQAEPNRLKNGNFIVSYSFTSGYAIGEREIYTTNANLTNNFKLNVIYYQDQSRLLATESVTIRASQFDESITFADLVNLNKYMPSYYNPGVVTNFGNRELTYENLRSLGVLVINYEPIVYNVTVNYMSDNGSGTYNDLVSVTCQFTYPQVVQARSIGQIVDLTSYKPEGYKTSIVFDGSLTVEGILAAAPLYVFYRKVTIESSKTVTITYKQENDNGEYETIASNAILCKESDFTDGMTLRDVININAYKPLNYYNDGHLEDNNEESLITYNDLEIAYTVKYPKTVYNIYVEYYLGTYPGWSRLTTITVPVTYKSSFTQSFSVGLLGVDLNRYYTTEYLNGALYNQNNINSFDDVLNYGVLQVYYIPIEYTIRVRYSAEDNSFTPVIDDITVTALDFLSGPVLNDIVPVTAHRPNGYQFSTTLSYHGDITLQALLRNSPIDIVYEEIEEVRAKNIIIRYKKEMASANSTINTSLITVNESDVQGGIRLKDLFNLNLYKPEYYENGIVNGYSSTALNSFDDLQSSYDVIYFASTYNTQVQYYTDDVDPLNWVGSSFISYRLIDFDVETTLVDLGLNLNLYKTVATDDGVLQYTGPITFVALRELPSIDVVYDTVIEPDTGVIDYPHRFLFLQHNDMGSFESQYPTWTLNHAYINTGVTVDDITRLTVVCECARVDENVPLHEVNEQYGYLFGSESGQGKFFMRFHNQTRYGRYYTTGLPGYNTYEAQCGNWTSPLVLTEEYAVGFGLNAGIYALDRAGYSTATFTYSNLLESEPVRMIYPLYLFANNYSGNYSDGLAGYGIYNCRIYYNGNLIRDFIPVQFYDRIGNLVAPSNCLYDKVTNTFFEDATGQNSFNIRDDDRYQDDNLDHKISSCQVRYYKGDTPFQTLRFYFRASEFADGPISAYEKFMVDYYQPAYYHNGVIQDYSQKTWTFEGMSNQVYDVIYEEAEHSFIVNYYVEENGEQTLLASDQIGLEESDFLQAPTFGEIVRINKYKPEGYETDFEYTGNRVSLAKILDNAPYDIVYRPIQGELQIYTTTLRYLKKIYGNRNYEEVGTTTVSFDQSNFRDGEFLDYYIDFNLMKPASYYQDGEPYGWYTMDEMLDSPSKLRETYTILYIPEEQYIEVNYYTDDWDEANLIASTTWAVNVDQFEPGYPISLVDSLPNDYINKYKPAGCDGGIIQNPVQTFATFDELMAIEEIAIQYDTTVEPHDPLTAAYEKKIIYWGDPISADYMDDWDMSFGVSASPPFIMGPWNEPIYASYQDMFVGGRIPWIDLGYKPKEIGRLRVEMKAYAKPEGLHTITTTWGYSTYDYTYFFGYWGPTNPSFLGTLRAHKNAILHSGGGMLEGAYSNLSPGSSGCFGIRCRVPECGGWVYTTQGPTWIDNQPFSTSQNFLPDSLILDTVGVSANYRKGFYATQDENFNAFVSYHNYGFEREDYGDMYIHAAQANNPRYEEYHPSLLWDGQLWASPMANPYTIIFDAYNSYASVWREGDSNSPRTYFFDESGDSGLWYELCKPKGTLSLFQTTNPMNGEINIMAFNLDTYPALGSSGSFILDSQTAGQNPFSSDFNASYTDTQLTITGFDDQGNAIYEEVKVTRNVNYASFALPAFPQMSGCAVWWLKIYDRDRLVRDLIPVHEGDVIYDYTMPGNGLFDLVTEIFFGYQTAWGKTFVLEGTMGRASKGHFERTIGYHTVGDTKYAIPGIGPYTVECIPDPTIWGKVTANYYDYDNSLINSQFVDVPTWFNPDNAHLADVLRANDFKPDEFHLDGMLDLDLDLSFEWILLSEIYEMGAFNVYYKLRTFTKTVVYYRDNVRIGSRDLFYSLDDIKNAETLEDLGIDVDLYYDSHFKHGRVVFDESIIASNDVQAFIDAPSPIVVYDKFTYNENPDIVYYEYYRGGAYDDTLITFDPENPNYLDCDLTAVVLNPNGAIKYYNHYHTALYEDETNDTFIPYQVRVLNRYAGIHRGPARNYQTLAMIVVRDTYTIIEERNGWGRLKEYPIGWILLNQTEPIAGPGQNPDYDVPGSDVATIPFAEHINITKMTIDRLWCYVEDQESWIKAEDISYDQSGKLYNGLAIEYVDLTTNMTSGPGDLQLWGIYANKYRLRFHNNGQYMVQGTIFTRQQLQQLHEIDIVYPETIYNYNCIYYRYYRDSNNELGRHSFSCSISDWNPDWDKFLETSWLTEDQPQYGYIAQDVNSSFYILDAPASSGNTVRQYNPGNNVFRITGYAIENRDGKFYPVESIDGRYSGYYYWVPISEGGARHEIISEYQGTVTVDVDPTLYRDTEILLNWSFFGCGRDDFRPVGMGPGFFVWNPRSWDKDNEWFTFYDLVRCGTQYVIYPPFDPNTYKIYSKRNQLAWDGGMYGSLYNGGIPVDLRGTEDYYTFLRDGSNVYDIYTSGELMPMQVDRYDYTHTYRSWWEKLENGNNTGGIQHYLPINYRYFDLNEGDKFIWNFSNRRESPAVVFGKGNDYENQEVEYYALMNNPGNSASNSEWRKIEPTLNMKNFAVPKFETHESWWLGSCVQGTNYTYNMEAHQHIDYVGAGQSIGTKNYALQGVIYDTMSYENSYLIHYWVPVPRGLRYYWDDQYEAMPDNGLFDMITGEFSRSYRMEDGNVVHSGYTWTPVRDGQDIIQLRNEEFGDGFNYFEDWIVNKTDYTGAQLSSGYGKLSNGNTYGTSGTNQGYSKPDTFAPNMYLVDRSVLVPIISYTNPSIDSNVAYLDENYLADNSHNYWYYDGLQWFPHGSFSVTSSGGSFNTNPSGWDDIQNEYIYSLDNGTGMLVWQKTTLCLTPINGHVRLMKIPLVNTPLSNYGINPWITTTVVTSSCYITQNGVIKAYWVGQGWVPVEYTQHNVLAVNESYVVASTTRAYTYPIEDNQYMETEYRYGDRILVTRKLVTNPDWLWTGEYWIKKTSSNLSIIE